MLHNKAPKHVSFVLLPLFSLLFTVWLTACAQSGDEEPANTGEKQTVVTPIVEPKPEATTLIFNDSPVDGITYECGGYRSTTSNGGKFSCVNAPVSFFIGTLKLGEISTFPEDGQVFPQDLVGVARNDFNQSDVIKIARLLQSLDDDGDIATAITITPAIAANFTADATLSQDLTALLKLAKRDPVSQAFAIAHLKRSLQGGENATDYSLRILVNAANQNEIGITTPVALHFSGAELLESNASDTKITQTVELNGTVKFITLYLRNQPETNQDVLVTAKARGYVDTGASILLNKADKRYILDLHMVADKEGEVAQGVFSSKLDVTQNVDENGTTNSVIVAQNKASAFEPGVKVSIDKGTVMRDDEGNEVKGASMRVVRFDPYEEEALAAYPGGLDVIAQVDGFEINGETQSGEQPINFKSAGFTAVNISDEAGHKVKQFSKPIEIAMQFKVGTRDEKGNIVAIGDSVPIWAYNEDKGTWFYEKYGTVQDLNTSDGLFDVIYQTDHLTYFNLDWHYGNKCTTATYVLKDKNGNQLTNYDGYNYQLNIASTPPISRWFWFTKDISFNNAPAGFSGTISVYNSDKTKVLGSYAFTDICEQSASSTIDILIDVSIIDDRYQRAKEKLASLSAAQDKSAGISALELELQFVRDLINHYLSIGDEKAQELQALLRTVTHDYTSAFLENINNIYTSRVTSIGFINSNELSIYRYGCINTDLKNYFDEINENIDAYTASGGTKAYNYLELVKPFYKQAAQKFANYSPDTLATSAKGVSGFYECGEDIYQRLNAVSVNDEESDTLLTNLTKHYEPVFLKSVALIKDMADDELANGKIVDNNVQIVPVGFVSTSTAETLRFILDDSLTIAAKLKAINAFSTLGMEALEETDAYLKQLYLDGKVVDEVYPGGDGPA